MPVGNLAESAKMHATQKSKFRRPSRYLERARNYRDGEWVLRSYACRCFSARGASTGLRSRQTKKLSKLLTKGLVLIYVYIYMAKSLNLSVPEPLGGVLLMNKVCWRLSELELGQNKPYKETLKHFRKSTKHTTMFKKHLCWDLAIYIYITCL